MRRQKQTIIKSQDSGYSLSQNQTKINSYKLKQADLITTTPMRTNMPEISVVPYYASKQQNHNQIRKKTKRLSFQI